MDFLVTWCNWTVSLICLRVLLCVLSKPETIHSSCSISIMYKSRQLLVLPRDLDIISSPGLHTPQPCYIHMVLHSAWPNIILMSSLCIKRCCREGEDERRLWVLCLTHLQGCRLCGPQIQVWKRTRRCPAPTFFTWYVCTYLDRYRHRCMHMDS